MVKGDLPAWRARRVARETMVLSLEAAAYVDRHVAHVAHKVRPAQLDRLVEEAIGRFMPEEAERRRRQAADGRSFTIDTRQPSLRGTSTVYGELDLADALDLDAAVAAGAQALKDLGSTDTLDVRRATAVGDLARRQLTLDLNPTPDATPDGHGTRTRAGRHRDRRRRRDGRARQTRRPPRGRPASRVRWCCTCTSPTPPSSPARRWTGEFGRVENTRGPVHAEQIRQWCGNPDAEITVQPVLDLNEHIDVEAYEIRGRLREQTILTHPTCVFPWCTQTRPRPGTRRARRRLRPPGPLRQGRAQLLLQHRPAVPAASPGQDPRRLDLHRPGTRDLRVDQPATGTSTCATTTAPST